MSQLERDVKKGIEREDLPMSELRLGDMGHVNISAYKNLSVIYLLSVFPHFILQCKCASILTSAFVHLTVTVCVFSYSNGENELCLCASMSVAVTQHTGSKVFSCRSHRCACLSL